MDHNHNELSNCFGAQNGNDELIFSPHVNICSQTKEEEEKPFAVGSVRSPTTLTFTHTLVHRLTCDVLDACETSRCGDFSLRKKGYRRHGGSGGAAGNTQAFLEAFMHVCCNLHVLLCFSVLNPACLLSGSSSSR